MFERVVEHWLTSVGERGYETAFAQLLSIEGHRVIQGPVHHGSEHGKDILSVDPRGRLCAFQLKGKVPRLEDLEQHQAQLLALSAAAVQHPDVQPPRRPDAVWLVTNSVPSPNARNRILALSQGNTAAGQPPLGCVELTELVGRFVRAHGQFYPSDPKDVRQFLSFHLDEGVGLFPVQEFDAFLENLIPRDRGAALDRAVASAVLFTAYAAGPWERLENHFAIAQAWLTIALVILRRRASTGESPGLAESYSLARDAAGGALAALTREAANAEDLIIPSFVEGQIYGSRALVVCGAIAARFLDLNATSEGCPIEVQDLTRQVLVRELPFIRIPGESAIPYLYAIVCALEALGERDAAVMTMARATAELVKSNQPDSDEPAADPYHSIEEELLHLAGVDQPRDDERMSGHAYTLQLSIDWLARRGYREFLADGWKRITRIDLCELRFSTPEAMLKQDDDEAELHMLHAARPESWARLSRAARTLDRGEIPEILWEHPDFLCYLPLLIPHHFGPLLAKAIDLYATGCIDVDGDPPA